MAERLFREDLYYRVSELSIAIPPLRARPGDAILIARALLSRFRELYGAQVRDFSPSALAAIEAHDWPGNVRELENRVKRAVIMADHLVIEAADLELELPVANGFRTLREVRDEAEAGAIQLALAASRGQIGKAADVLGVSRPTVYHLIKKYGLH
jgi:two-component system NtrC family response regulator